MYQSVFRPDLFAGQVVVVTGGGSGIGRCIAHELATLGAHVALVGRDAWLLVQDELAQQGETKPAVTAAISATRQPSEPWSKRY